MSRPDVTKASVAAVLFEIGALRFGRFTLSSGRSSSYYLDLRMVPSYPGAYAVVLDAYREVASQIGEASFDVIAGVATAGIAMSSPLAFLMKKPMVYVRSQGKGHGLGRLVEGAVKPGLRALVVDDLVTSGESIVVATEALRREGCVVTEAAVLVDRMEGGEENLRSIGVKLRPYAKVKELIDILYAGGKVTKRDYEAVLKQIRGVRR